MLSINQLDLDGGRAAEEVDPMRRLDEPVLVRAADEQTRPGQFIWRGRLYVVRSVVDHWRERRAWWRDLVDGSRADPTVGADPQPSADLLAPESLEHEVWRVEASAGRLAGSGIYDLRCARGEWSLVRLAD